MVFDAANESAHKRHEALTCTGLGASRALGSVFVLEENESFDIVERV